MSAAWDGEALLAPISADEPCGPNLEDTDTLGAFDTYQLFGQVTLEADPEAPRKHRPPDWKEIRERAIEALAASRDLRLVTHLAAALLRTDGVPAFAETLGVASAWLDRYWAQVYPRIEEEDAIFRRNALNGFADPVAILDGLRRAPLVSHRQHGRYSLRDLELASGQMSGAADPPPDEAQIRAAFSETPIEELRSLSDAVTRAVASVARIDETMRREGGSEAAPGLEGLATQLKKMAVALKAQMAGHPQGSSEGEEGGAPAAAEGGGTVVAVGAIRSRQDAVRALEAAAEFFRRNEPSSPIPLLLDRARRLVSKDFLDVLADMAPDALPQARSAGGLRDE